MACGVSMERYDPGEQDWIVFNNFWPKEVSEKVKKGRNSKKFKIWHVRCIWKGMIEENKKN